VAGLKASYRVRIDGRETVLTYDRLSWSRGHQYLTPGNVTSHAFEGTLAPLVGAAFTVNGHRYEVLEKLPCDCASVEEG
jgi:hypothetical protein